MKFEIKANVENGALKTNAEELKKAVIPELKKYEYVVDNNTYDNAKKDRTALNKLIKQVSDERKRIEDELFGQWKKDKATLMEIEKAIKARADELGGGINEIDDIEKQKKYVSLEEWWNKHIKYNVDYSLVHESKYLNKSSSADMVQKSLVEKIKKITQDFTIMKTFLPNDDFESEQIINTYLNTIDISKAKEKADELLELHKKIDKMVEKEPEQGKFNYQNQEIEYANSNVSIEDAKVYWAKFEIEGSREAFLRLPNVLKDLGITYKVLEKGVKQ